MASPKAPERKIEVHVPQWDKIMTILGSPSQTAIFKDTANWVSPSSPVQFEALDGAWDQEAAQKGIGMRRVSCDVGKSVGPIEKPSGFVFVCKCGYARRVIDSEHAFTCERPNGKGSAGCGILWQKDAYLDQEDLHQTSGLPIAKEKLEERTAPNGRKYLMPIIKGYSLPDWRYMQQKANEEAGDDQEAFEREKKLVQDGKIVLVSPEDAKKLGGGK